MVGEIPVTTPSHLFPIWFLLSHPLLFHHLFCVCLLYPLDPFPLLRITHLPLPFSLSLICMLFQYLLLFILMTDTSLHTLTYMPVAKKVHAVLAPLDKEFCITWSLPDDLLSRLQPLPSHPPDFIPGVCFTQECADSLDLDPTNWLWPDKVKLIHRIVLEHEMDSASIPTKHGGLNKGYFPPVKIPTILHTPWVLQNIPILPSTVTHKIVPMFCTFWLFIE